VASRPLATVQEGVEVVAQIEIDDNVVRVLEANLGEVPHVYNIEHFPVVECHVDICTITFPCNRTSQAGTRTGCAPTGDAEKVPHHMPVSQSLLLPCTYLVFTAHPYYGDINTSRAVNYYFTPFRMKYNTIYRVVNLHIKRSLRHCTLQRPLLHSC
jgi:hypothetical protein